MKQYDITYKKGELYHAIIVVAESADIAAAYFQEYKPTAEIIGDVKEHRGYIKPGMPIITVPAEWVPEEQEEREEQEEQAAVKYTHRSRYFCGHEISPYGLEHGYMDYRTLAKAFDAVMCNDIITRTYDRFYWDLVNGTDYDEETGETTEVFQFFIISDMGAEILMDYTNEIVWYNEDLDLYVWGVTHYGTAWDYVLTDIPVKLDEEA